MKKGATDCLEAGLKAFLTVLRSGWSQADHALFEVAGWAEWAVRDWCQANWEMLVEAAVSCGFGKQGKVRLEIYGPGACRNRNSSRVWEPQALPTHRVICVLKNDGVVEKLSGKLLSKKDGPFDFVEFVSLTEPGDCDTVPPFDHAYVDISGVEGVLDLEAVSFELRPVG